MKKKIAIITLIPSSGWFYAEQVQQLFGDLAEVKAYSTGDMSVERIELSDIYLVTTDAFKVAEETWQYVPADGQVVEIQVTYPKEVICELKKIPEGTRVLFVNATRQMAREAVTQLEQLGVNQRSLSLTDRIPCILAAAVRMEAYLIFPFRDLPIRRSGRGSDIAVTPDEEAFVPAGMKQVINIGPRCCTPATVMEAAIHLGLERLLEGKHFQNYKKPGKH